MEGDRSAPGRDPLWVREGSGPPILTRAAAYPLLGLLVLALGVNWPLLATGLRDISPVWMTAFRLAGGALVVLAVTAASGRLRLPPRHDWPVVWSVAVFRLAVLFLLVFTALRIVPPGRSSVLVWTAGLWTVPIAAVFLGERMNARRWAGLTLGIGGIAVLFEPWGFVWSDLRVLGGHALLLAAAVTNAAVSVHIRRHPWVTSPLRAMPWQLLIATLPVLAAALAVEGIPRIDWTPALVGIVVYQGTLATSFGMWAQMTVLRSLPAVSTNLSLMMVPAVGLASSALLVDERITPAVTAGLVLVVAGVGLNLLADTTH